MVFNFCLTNLFGLFQHFIPYFFINFVRLAQDPDPHLGSDPQKMNVDPQPWFSKLHLNTML